MGLSYMENVHLELHDNILEDAHFVVEKACAFCGEWDVIKSKVKNFAQHTWEVHVKARGANLGKLKPPGIEQRTTSTKPAWETPTKGWPLTYTGPTTWP